ncbi:MAG TPA: O-antigen ligase family protein [Chthoniobacterales bacterium]|nr:O-antigen ligase family protein [Chthoniobacterales bacterium]
MSASIKVFVVAALGLVFAVLIGSQLGSGSWTIPLIIVGSCLLGVVLHLFAKGVRPEALILGFLFIGYIVGNRGFANISLSRTLPLYLGEVSLIACAAIMFCRRAFTRQRMIPKTFLGRAITAFVVIGALRTLYDLERGAFEFATIVRDAATVYYALFFYIGYYLGNHPKSRAVLDRAIVFAFVLLIPAFVVSAFWPDALLHLTLRGYPLILLKGDLAATFLGIGSFYLFLSSDHYRRKPLWIAGSLILFGLMAMGLMRAAVVGFMLATVLLLYASEWRLLRWQIGVGLLAAIILMLVQNASTTSREENFLVRITDRLYSMTDPFGTKQYRLSSTSSSLNNTRFRTEWWLAVWRQTIDKGPITGLGFGYDLASRFLMSYDLPLERDFTTRSPHGIFVTVLGRMGFIGLISFTVVCVGVFSAAFRRASLVRRRKLPAYELRHWCAVLMILGAATFGVVLEGPMGGVLFWSLLGLACSEPNIAETPRSRKQLIVPTNLPEATKEPISV